MKQPMKGIWGGTAALSPLPGQLSQQTSRKAQDKAAQGDQNCRGGRRLGRVRQAGVGPKAWTRAVQGEDGAGALMQQTPSPIHLLPVAADISISPLQLRRKRWKPHL